MPWGQGGPGVGASWAQSAPRWDRQSGIHWAPLRWHSQRVLKQLDFAAQWPHLLYLHCWILPFPVLLGFLFLWTLWFHLNPQHYKGLCCWACSAAPRRAGIAASAVPAAQQHCRTPHPEPQNTTLFSPSGPGLYLVSLSKQNCLRRSRASS